MDIIARLYDDHIKVSNPFVHIKIKREELSDQIKFLELILKVFIPDKFTDYPTLYFRMYEHNSENYVNIEYEEISKLIEDLKEFM